MNKFVVVGTQRTGSSAIAESIGLHPSITCGWEWILTVSMRHKLNTAKKALSGHFSVLSQADQDHMADVHHPDIEWIGFRWLFSSSNKWTIHPRLSPALWKDQLENFIVWASRHPDIHLIHVIRQNGLDWLKSIYMARKAKLYSKGQYPEGLKVHIPKLQAIHRLKAKNWVDSRINSLELTNPLLSIIYEDFMRNQDEEIVKIFKFLKCDPITTSVQDRSLIKQSKGRISDYIINYDQLREVLSKKNL